MVEPFAPFEVPAADVGALEQIAQLRYRVWRDEGSLDLARFPDGAWRDLLDASGRHWVATGPDGALVAAARLTLHADLADTRDTQLWRDAGRPLPLPVADLSRLVVARAARGRGLAGELNRLRVEAARAAGAGSVIATASEANARLLQRLGFADTGRVVTFPDRPGVPFLALELIFG